MRAVAVIPARSGSERLPRKNLATLEGRSLVRRALETALAAGFDCVALSSDSDEILAEAEGLQVACVRRPVVLASSTARTFDVVIHALAELEREERFDVVAVVQATSPFTAPEDLAGARELLERSGAASVVSVARLEAGLPPAEAEAARCGWTAHGLSRRRRADPLPRVAAALDAKRLGVPLAAARCSTAGR